MYALETLTVDRAKTRLAERSCREVFDYWDRLRDDRNAPDRRELEPSDIAHLLGDVVLLELSGSRAHFRLAGSRLTAALGRDIKHASLADLWQEPDRARIEELIDSAQSMPAGAALTFDMLTERERIVPFEAVLLPLLLDGVAIRRLIGAITPLEQPYWLGSDAHVAFVLRSASIFATRPDQTMTRRELREHPIFARAKPRRILRHLALYDGDLSGTD